MQAAKTDQTGQMPRLISVFAGRTHILLVLSCRGSFGVLYYRCLTFGTYGLYKERRWLYQLPDSSLNPGEMVKT